MNRAERKERREDIAFYHKAMLRALKAGDSDRLASWAKCKAVSIRWQ